MAKFRKKPVIVQAEQFWHDKSLPFNDRGPYVKYDGTFYVTTIHGQRADLVDSDWVIIEPVRAGAPRYAAYPCKPDIFAATYESVEVPSVPSNT